MAASPLPRKKKKRTNQATAIAATTAKRLKPCDKRRKEVAKKQPLFVSRSFCVRSINMRF
jgi:hypothetical protein